MGQNKKHKSSLTDADLENDEYYRNFMNQNFPGYLEDMAAKKARKKKLRPLWISLSSGLTAVAALILTLIFIWPLIFPEVLPPGPGPDPGPGKHYAIENEAEENIDLNKLNQDLVGFFMQPNEEYDKKITRIYDSESNDILYYNLELKLINDEANETIRILIYNNPDYENKNELPDFGVIETITIGDFEISYTKTIQNEDWIYILNYSAVTEYNGITIYIECEQWSLDETGNFFDFFEQTFQTN